MGKVNTSDVKVNRTREATPGVLPAQPRWQAVEINSAPSFGSEFKRTARNPINGDRQRLKGAITDLDSPLEMECDLTLSQFRETVESFFYARATGPVSRPATAMDAGGVTVAALDAAGAAQFTYGALAAKTLVYVSGFAKPQNNGLKPITGVVANGATNIPVAGVAVEAADATKDRLVAIAGVRGAAGDLKIDGNGDLISTVLDFTTLGLPPGAAIHIGGGDIANRFFKTENYGFARVVLVEARKVTLDRTRQTFVADDGTVDNAGGAGAQIDILFGALVRNVALAHPDYRVFTDQFEFVMPGLGASNETLYQYAVGAHADSMVIGLPLTDKASLKFGYTSLDTTDPASARATNAAQASVGAHTEAFSTTADLARLRVMEADETGMATDFKSLTVNIKNNTSGEKILGKLGPKYVNPGTFEVDIEFEAIFTDKAVIEAIRANRTIGLDFALHNNDGCIFFDIPSATLDGGKRNLKENESVTISGSVMAHRDPVLLSSIGVTIFPFIPTE